MTSIRSKAIIRGIKSAGLLNTKITAENLETKRKDFKKLEKFFPTPSLVKISPVVEQNFNAEWIVAPKSREDKVLLYLHGGGFVFDGTKLYRDMISRIARAGAVTALSLDYSLAPEHPYPVAQNEALAAYRWLLDTGYKAGNIVVGGDSAGGALALSLMHTIRNAQLPYPSCVFVMSPATDATLSDSSLELNRSKDFYIDVDTLQYFIEAYFQDTPTSDPIASPLLGSLKGFPPILIHVDKNEVMNSDSVRFAEKAKKAGVKVELHQSEGLFHVWHIFARYMPEARRSINDIGKFIQQNLRNTEKSSNI